MRLREVGLQLGFRTDPSFLLCFKHLFLHNIVTYRTDVSYRYEDKRVFMRALKNNYSAVLTSLYSLL